MPVGTRLTTIARPVGGGGGTGQAGPAARPRTRSPRRGSRSNRAALTNQRSGSPMTASLTASARPPRAASESGRTYTPGSSRTRTAAEVAKLCTR